MSLLSASGSGGAGAPPPSSLVIAFEVALAEELFENGFIPKERFVKRVYELRRHMRQQPMDVVNKIIEDVLGPDPGEK